MQHEVNHRVTQLFLLSISDLARAFAASVLSLALPDVRALVCRVVEQVKITDVACCSEHHQLLMISTILSQLCSDSNRNVHLSVFGCNCERLRNR